ncbi:polysaccharide export protein [Halomonas alkalisoli]|uniref:polysaccharide export protein n=1 Tax=Halomonas alkalisoli TaxID=2907158 RepID=UPI001EEC6AC9|nr:polysaccharide export protein [Halomonas alkalisoli]MCE9683153.1 polysaccharide biosynthesis/export family protein [Halomonas alkalisoli]
MRTLIATRQIFILIATLTLGGCVIAPGGHMDYDTGDAPELDHLVDIEPITPELINSLERAERRVSPMPNTLRSQIADYEYVVGPGDVLSIVVYDHPELTIPAGAERSPAEVGNQVRADGTIFYPFLGRINVAGKNTDQIRLQMTRGLSQFLTDPQVDVFVAAFNAKKIYVTGAVGSPGVLSITNVPMTLIDAISEVGGPTGNAFWHDLTFIRDGQEERLSLYALLSEGDQRQNRLLQDGDIIHVPTAENQGIAMMGQIRSPGNLPMNRERLSLSDAISRAGGINEITADASGIFVLRRQPETSDKLATVYQLNVKDATAFALAGAFPLEPRDIVYVTTAPLARWNRVISLLLPSIGLPGNIRGSTANLDELL